MTEQQIEQAKKWILSGASSHDVAEAIRATFPDIDQAELVLQALEVIRSAAVPDVPLLRGWIIESTREVYRRSLESNDHGAALRALKMLGDMAKHPLPVEDARDERFELLAEIDRRQQQVATLPGGLVKDDLLKYGPLCQLAEWFQCSGDDAKRMRFSRALQTLASDGLIELNREDGRKWSNARLTDLGLQMLLDRAG